MVNFSRFEPFKVLAHADKLKVLANNGICSPVLWMVYPSNVCNLDCGHCIMREERRGCEMLSEEVMNRVVKDVVRHGSRCVLFAGGGEPLTNPHTMPTIEKLKSIGVEVGINTNGLLLPEHTEIDYLRISVDAASRTTYAKVKGRDEWGLLNSRLRQLKNVGELGLAFLAEPDNMHEIGAFVEWAQQFPYNFLHIRPAYWPEHDAEIKAGLEENAELIAELQANYRNVYYSAHKFDGFWSERQYSKCRATPLKAVLCADARFAVCQDNFIKFGDYARHNFDSIWYGQEHRAALESIDLDACPRCVETGHNGIIEHCFCADDLKVNLI